MLELTPEQKKILDTLMYWFDATTKRQYITFGGFAGTGKTTLISVFRETLFKKKPKIKVAYAAYTGKATLVIKSKLTESKTLKKGDFVGTIHSLIYSPMLDQNEQIIGWERKDKLNFDLIIIDEASMVDEDIWKDLMKYKIPIIAVGDHGQLPPIRGKLNLMAKPDLRLEKIHRQSESSPIIELSILARNEGRIPVGRFGDGVVKYDKTDSETQGTIGELLQNYNNDTLVLCGYNYTRIKLNKFIRESLEFYDPEPMSGDRVICLRNNHQKFIFNGMIGTIRSIEEENEEIFRVKIDMDNDDMVFNGYIYKDQFNNSGQLNFTDQRKKYVMGDLFDFGYALTVHKAQGSQAKRVVLFEERFSKMDDEMWRRWLYTAVTRAEEELVIIGS